MNTRLLSLTLLAATAAYASGPKVAILGSDSTTFIADVETKLVATGLFSTVDFYNITSSYPSLATLQTYSAILVWTQNPSPAGFGDELANYIDAGGRVADAVFANASVPIGGRFSSGGYELITVTGQTQGVELTLGTYDASSPLMQGVSTFDGGLSSYHGTGSAVVGTTLVASWSNGAPLVLSGTRSGQPRVSLNMYPPSNTVRFDLWHSTTDGARMMANALLYLSAPDLTISKAHVGSGFFLGETNAQYTLTVANSGFADATGTITVSDTLPTGLSFASGSGTGWTCSAIGQMVTCTDLATPIASGANSSITLNVNVALNAPPTESNFATVACSCTESDTNNNTSATDVVSISQSTVNPPPVLPFGTGNPDAYQVLYFANTTVGDQYVDITNSGASDANLFYGTTATTSGSICVNVYAFAPDEQLLSCCACPVTPNGVKSLSLWGDIRPSILNTAEWPSSLTIALTATQPVGGSCSGTAQTPVIGSTLAGSTPATTGTTLASGLLAAGTTLHALASGGPAAYKLTERMFQITALSTADSARLTQLCLFLNVEGGGLGVCSSCQLGALAASKK